VQGIVCDNGLMGCDSRQVPSILEGPTASIIKQATGSSAALVHVYHTAQCSIQID